MRISDRRTGLELQFFHSVQSAMVPRTATRDDVRRSPGCARASSSMRLQIIKLKSVRVNIILSKAEI